jgi:hypothetical protein
LSRCQNIQVTELEEIGIAAMLVSFSHFCCACFVADFSPFWLPLSINSYRTRMKQRMPHFSP